MIEYSGGARSFVRLRGSVLPKALAWAVPAACLVVAYRTALELWSPGLVDGLSEPTSAETSVGGLFTSILGFLIVFRANLAYGRFWEGITLVERSCAVWLNGVSNLIAFCNAGEEHQVEVATFQHLLSRLMSLLLSVSLADISRLDSAKFPTLSLDGISPESIAYLTSAHSKQKVVLQWIQRLVTEQHRAAVVDVAPPILSRVFQEFSLGIVNLIEARKLTCVPFPFPFAQVVVIMLCLFASVLMPLVCALYMPLSRGVPITFLVVLMFMGIHNISVEIEQPFGGDPNDLPLEEISRNFNEALMTLLEAEAQQTPVLVKSTDEIKHHVEICRHIAAERSSVKASAMLSTSSLRNYRTQNTLGKLGDKLWKSLSMRSRSNRRQVAPTAPADGAARSDLGDQQCWSDASSSIRAHSKGSCASSIWVDPMASLGADNRDATTSASIVGVLPEFMSSDDHVFLGEETLELGPPPPDNSDQHLLEVKLPEQSSEERSHQQAPAGTPAQPRRCSLGDEGAHSSRRYSGAARLSVDSSKWPRSVAVQRAAPAQPKSASDSGGASSSALGATSDADLLTRTLVSVLAPPKPPRKAPLEVTPPVLPPSETSSADRESSELPV